MAAAKVDEKKPAYEEKLFTASLNQLLEEQWVLMDQNKDGFIDAKDAEAYMKALTFEPTAITLTWNSILRRHKATATGKVAKADWIAFRRGEQMEGAQEMLKMKQNPMDILDEERNLKMQLEQGLKK